MLIPAYRNLIKLGIPFKKVILLYRKISCKDILSKFLGIGYAFFKLFFTRIEAQFLDSQKSLLGFSDETTLKTLNHTLIKKIPAFKLIQDLSFFNLIRHELIGSNKGYRLMNLLPLRGQRTWSNSRTTKVINKKARLFIINSSSKLLKSAKNKNKKLDAVTSVFSSRRLLVKKKINKSSKWS